MKKAGFITKAVLIVIAGTTCIASAKGQNKAPAPQGEKIVKCTIIAESGGPLAWDKKSNKILFSKIENDGWFDIWVMNPDGSGKKPLTSNHPKLPNTHIGQPAWHPSGQLVVFQVQKPNIPRQYHTKCTPGAGALNDLWIITPDEKRIWKLHSVRDSYKKDTAGVLHPHFSHDGTKLFWAERVKDNNRAFGEWKLRIAEFSYDEESGPRLEKIRDYNPGGKSSFFESHNFSPDDKYVLFTGNQDGPLEIYEMEVATGKVKRLTNHSRRTWDEHAQYSPDGKKIVWMSSQDVKFRKRPFFLQTEFWIMDRDGSNQRRLTWFNEPGHPHYLEKKFSVAGDSAWSPDGKYIAGLVISSMPDSDERDSGIIVLIDLPDDFGLKTP